MIGYLRTMYLRWLDRHDDAWKPTGIRQVYDTYDQSKASALYQRSRRQTATGRPLPKPQKRKSADVYVLPSRRRGAR